MDCYNYHKEGTFAQESSSKKSDYKNKESTRRTVHVETSTSTALVSYDGLGGGQERNWTSKKNDMFLLIRQRLSATTVTEKGILLENARSGRNQGRKSYGDNGRSNAPTNESSSQALMAQDGLGGYDWSNDFEVEPANYALMAISYSSSSSSFDNGGYRKCSTTNVLNHFKTLQKTMILKEKNITKQN
ncbi:hypothetical protein Tco_1006602 [Tanacetum coccineum]|uniref:Uncharacterized protein n=1 Tax=Tanacetum coccineum TaxID=301880 RepID=A0ABQ5FJ27_9ASTR